MSLSTFTGSESDLALLELLRNRSSGQGHNWSTTGSPSPPPSTFATNNTSRQSSSPTGWQQQSNTTNNSNKEEVTRALAIEILTQRWTRGELKSTDFLPSQWNRFQNTHTTIQHNHHPAPVLPQQLTKPSDVSDKNAGNFASIAHLLPQTAPEQTLQPLGPSSDEYLSSQVTQQLFATLAILELQKRKQEEDQLKQQQQQQQASVALQEYMQSTLTPDFCSLLQNANSNNPSQSSLEANRMCSTNTSATETESTTSVSTSDQDYLSSTRDTPRPSAPAPAASEKNKNNKPKKTRPGRLGSFPQKLHQMLNELKGQGREDIASFVTMDDSSSAFMIHRPRDFADMVMHRYFKMKTYSSFQRQLNLYCFVRVKDGPHKGAYKHPFFVQDRPLLSTSMRRTRIKGGSHPQTA